MTENQVASQSEPVYRVQTFSESSTGSGSERFILFVLTAIQFTNILDFVILMPLGPQLMRIFSISPQQFGLVVSAYTFSAGASGFLAAFFLDRYDRKKSLLALYAGFTTGTFLCSMAPTYWFLYLFFRRVRYHHFITSDWQAR